MNSKQFKQLLKNAEAGDLVAQCSLAAKYAKGSGVELDYKAALHWYGRAAAIDFEIAKYNIAMMHLMGEGVKKDVGVAVEKLKDAVKSGSPEAALVLGDLYASEDDDIDIDPVESARYRLRAALLGEARGIREIAWLLDKKTLSFDQLKNLMRDFKD